MRKRITAEEKRSEIIGVKVKTETKRKLKYIAKRDCTQLSTYIDTILVKHIDEYFNHAHINWENLSEKEKDGEV